jgi:hypothetical protein
LSFTLYGEIQMARSTFSGPIRAGNIPNTTGTTVGTDIANVGQVVMAQSQQVTQAASATSIVIPANSQIVEINLYVTTAWDGAATTLGIGNTALATAYTAASAVAGGTIGIVTVTPGTDATRTLAFVDVGTTDVKFVVTSTNTGAGVGYLTVRYVQANNLVA